MLESFESRVEGLGGYGFRVQGFDCAGLALPPPHPPKKNQKQENHENEMRRFSEEPSTPNP